MKKHLLLFVFCLTHLLASAQDWSIRYVGNYPNGYIHFLDGIIDEDGVTFLVGHEGPNYDSPKALFMRIDSDGNPTVFKYNKTGFYSRATCIIELSDHKLFASGNLYGDTDDYFMVWILDKDLNLLEERLYEKEVECNSFDFSRAVLDNNGNVIVSTCIVQDNEFMGLDYRGVFFKFDQHGDTLCHRYLHKEYPDPVFFLNDFRVRQMWHKDEEESLLCLVSGQGGILSFVTFDSAFNYIDEHPIWRDSIDKSDHTLYKKDCFTDHWYSNDEALFFSSLGDFEHNKLRVSRVNTHGEILDFIRLYERTDTIDDAASVRCMATANDSTIYFSFHYHTWPYYPGIACVYLLNDRLEIVGRHIDDDHDCYRSCLILPTSDGGCITVNDSCQFIPTSHSRHPIINKLSRSDFETVTLTVSDHQQRPTHHKAFPNPCEETLHIPLPGVESANIRCQVFDNQGRTIINRMIPLSGNTLDLDVSKLRTGLYHYCIYSNQEALLTDTFIKQ